MSVEMQVTPPAVKTAADLLLRIWNAWQERRDPVRAQAARVLRAFEAHGIARTQIVRLLPSELALPMTAFANPQSLREHLSPAVLDWVAGFFLLDRAWLDCTPDAGPHSPYPHCFYKQPDALHDWLAERVGDRPKDFALYVLKADNEQKGLRSSGLFSLLLAEHHAELDGKSLRRFERLSDGAHFEHLPCVADLLATCAVADSLRIPLRGLAVGRKKLARLEAGSTLVAETLRRPLGGWSPESLLAPQCTEAPQLQLARREAADWLHAAGLDLALKRLHHAVAAP